MRPEIAGFYDGHVTDRATGTATMASAALDGGTRLIDGTLRVALGDAGTRAYMVHGRACGRRLVLAGANAHGTELTWRAKWMSASVIRGQVELRAADGGVTRGLLVLVRRSPPADACEAYFRDAVAEQMLVPVCVQCRAPVSLGEVSPPGALLPRLRWPGTSDPASPGRSRAGALLQPMRTGPAPNLPMVGAAC